MKRLVMAMRLLLLFSSLLLVACENLPLQEVDSVAFDELDIIKSNDKIYLKPHDGHRYGALSGHSISKSKLPETGVTQFHSFRLSNGLEVFILPRSDVPAISISAVVDAGRNFFSDADELRSPLVLKLLKQGTENYSRMQFQQLATQLGAAINYRQTAQFSVLSVDILPQDLNLAMTILSQQLMYLKPDSHALDKVIEQQLLDNKLAQSSGIYWAKRRFHQTHYAREHPYFSKEPERRKIRKITLQQLLAFYDKYYVPEGTRIILVGDLDVKDAYALINNHFGSWPSGGKSTASNDMTKHGDFPEPQSGIEIINRKAAQQADILYGAVTVPGNSQEKPALDIIAALLGGGPSSRLFTDLREQKGLAYSVFAYQIAGRYRSPFMIQTSVAHNKVPRTILAIKAHIDYICQNPIDERELKLLKQQLIGERLFQFQSNRQWVQEKIKQLESGYEDRDALQYGLRIKALKTDQLHAIINRYLCRQQAFIVVGDKSKLLANFRNKND